MCIRDREIRFKVIDDGTPLPQDFNLKKDRNLGLQIVESLVRDDLRGKFSILEENNKTIAAISFPK